MAATADNAVITFDPGSQIIVMTYGKNPPGGTADVTIVVNFNNGDTSAFTVAVT